MQYEIQLAHLLLKKKVGRCEKTEKTLAYIGIIF